MRLDPPVEAVDMAILARLARCVHERANLSAWAAATKSKVDGVVSKHIGRGSPLFCSLQTSKLLIDQCTGYTVLRTAI